VGPSFSPPVGTPVDTLGSGRAPPANGNPNGAGSDTSGSSAAPLVAPADAGRQALRAALHGWLIAAARPPGPGALAALARELETPAAAQRVAEALQPQDLLVLLQRLRPAEAEALLLVWPALRALAGPAAGGAPAAPSVWPRLARAVLRELFEEDRPLHPQGLLQRARESLLPQSRRQAQPRTRQGPQQGPSVSARQGRSAAPPGTAGTAHPRPHPAPSPAFNPGPSGTPGTPPAANLPDPGQPEPQGSEPDTDAWRTDRNPWLLPEPDPAEALFVGNAGLVLLAPYLERLFEMCGCTRGKAFVDTAAAERAALLLEMVATGSARAPEPRLPLNKLLAGLPLAAPLPLEVAATPADEQAVDGLLRAVIAHWKALGHTSPGGLRQTFLQREGRLERGDEAWHLHVPQQTFDMLLDRLPWGYTPVRLPRMPEVLHVHWR
jgi:hypothetical protein